MSKKAILIVEDEPAPRELLVASLETVGYITYWAEDGIKALELLNAHDIDLIVSDIHMPNMDGLELLKRVRTNGDETPIIFVTGLDPNDVRHTIERYKATDLIAKPYRFMILKKAMDKYLGEK